MKTCKRCFREFEESEVDVVDVRPATELADIFLRDVGVEDINDLCPQCREELGVMNLLGFGLYIACAFVHIVCELQHTQCIPKAVMLRVDTGVRMSYMGRQI